MLGIQTRHFEGHLAYQQWRHFTGYDYVTSVGAAAYVTCGRLSWLLVRLERQLNIQISYRDSLVLDP